MKPSEYTQAERPIRDLHPQESWLNKRALNTILSHLPRLRYGTLSLHLPSGRVLNFGQHSPGEPRAEVKLNSLKPIRRLLKGGVIGWSESYMEGEWDSPDLVALVRWAVGNESVIQDLFKGHPILRWINRVIHMGRANTKRGSRKNIAYHYDLGNEFYKLWLDPSMTYSSALFQGDEDLQAAQHNKYRRICDLLDLQPGQQVLEIGCGWGGFAELAAREYGAQVTGITLSKEQLSFARERIRRAGLDDQVNFSLTDYRDVTGTFDHIVSIEMFEAVGEENWTRYFEVVRERLKPEGRALLQIITIANERFDRYRKSADFIQRYIFPGGMLPSPEALQSEINAAELTCSHQQYFGRHYALTLAEWRHNFLNKWPEIKTQGFDERFRRMWLFYLTYCEGGFMEDTIDVGLFRIEHQKPH